MSEFIKELFIGKLDTIELVDDKCLLQIFNN
jgi:hypothetical protein